MGVYFISIYIYLYIISKIHVNGDSWVWSWSQIMDRDHSIFPPQICYLSPREQFKKTTGQSAWVERARYGFIYLFILAETDHYLPL